MSMEDLLWEVGSMVVVVGFIAFIIYLNHRDTVKNKGKKSYTKEEIDYWNWITRT